MIQTTSTKCQYSAADLDPERLLAAAAAAEGLDPAA